MSFFEKFKETLKPKWLDYYQINRSWIKTLMDARNGWVSTPDKGTRPSADLILGAITALEPRLAELMLPFCELNSNAEKLVELMGLHFDPRIELEKRAAEAATSQEASILPLLTDEDTEYLKKIREETVK
jgi:Family of unknown function (DUF5331)